MKCIYSKCLILGIGALVLLGLLFGSNGLCRAEGEALEQLLDLLRQNGAISNEQAKKIKTTLAKDQEAMAEREQLLEKRERALEKREAALKEREQTVLSDQEGLGRRSPEASPPPDVKPSKPHNEAGSAKVESDTVPHKDLQKENEFPLKAVFDDGFYLRSREKDLFELRVGGLLQVDYRYFHYDGNADPANNRFDIRRARLLLAGHLYERFSYKFQYEFQGAGSRRLLDAYGNVLVFPYLQLRAGQFKEPFSLEQYTSDANLPFPERAMGYNLTGGRDVGFMAHASCWEDRIWYGLGLFNGDGVDDTVGGDTDAPQFTGRVVYSPFKNMGLPFWNFFQIGGSYSYANVDRNNVKVTVNTAGLTKFFDVNSAAKFNIIRDVDSRTRYGAELAWAYGPVLLWGEYTNLQFSDVKTSDAQFDINLKDYYGAVMWMITGENPTLKKGVIQKIRPYRNLWQGGGWGALGLAFRYDHFDGGDTAYEYLIEPGNSVRKADAYTVVLNWYLNPYIRLLLSATRTNFDIPLLIEKDPMTGEGIYSDFEDVVTGRFQLQF